MLERKEFEKIFWKEDNEPVNLIGHDWTCLIT